jgi:hypothetical protein
LFSIITSVCRISNIHRDTTTSCLVYHDQHDILFGVRDKHLVISFHGTYLNEITRSPASDRAILCLELWREKDVLFASGVGSVIRGWWVRQEAKTAHKVRPLGGRCPLLTSSLPLPSVF